MHLFKHFILAILISNTHFAFAEEIITSETGSAASAEITTLASTEDISDSAQEKAKTKYELEKIIAIESAPLQNPNAALTELAFKFGRSNKAFVGFDTAYANYCADARDGNANAQFALGWVHEYGKGVPMDKSVAKFFYTIAAEQKHTLALKELPRLADEAEGELPKCMFARPKPVIYAVEKPELSHDELVQIELRKIRQASADKKLKETQDRADRIFNRQARIYRIVKNQAALYDMDPRLIMSFIAIESAFNVKATSHANAQGLMQLIPATARRFGVVNAYDAKQNIKGGIKYIRWLLAYYEGHVELAAAAYNAGEGAVDRYKGVPPYKETQHYVKKLARLYGKTEHPYEQSVANKRSPILESLVNNKHQM
jgi:soluble lytic murein transglycosylase-like protein